jgi:molybdopterin molybdotransferase
MNPSAPSPLSFSSALNQLLEQAKTTQQTEERSIIDALNCVLAAPIVSPINVPAIANSMMDGYGVKLSDTKLDVAYPVIQTIAAGEIGAPLKPGTAVRILTGAAVPEGVDTVIKQEWACWAENDNTVRFTQLPEQPGANIRKVGEDIAKGRTVLPQGKRLQPEDIGMLAATGQSHIKVYRPLTIGTFSTGDELLEPSEAPQLGKIYNTNRYMLQALLQQYGFKVVDLGRISDTLEDTMTALKTAAETADVIMTTGGVSVGDKDFIKPAIEQLGSLNMWRVAMKPGKPLAYGEVQGTPFIGLPGNPVAAFAAFYLFARPFLLKMQGVNELTLDHGCVSAGFDWPNASPRREFLRAKIERYGQCEIAVPYPNQGAGILSSLIEADGFAVVPENTTLNKGDPVSFIRFNELQ